MEAGIDSFKDTALSKLRTEVVIQFSLIIVVGRMSGKMGVILPVFFNIPFASILSI